VPHPRDGSSSTVPRSNSKLDVGLCEEGKTRVLGEKPLGARTKTNNKL